MGGVIFFFITSNLEEVLVSHVVYYCSSVIHSFVFPIPTMLTVAFVSLNGLYLFWILLKLFTIFTNTLKLMQTTKNTNEDIRYIKKLKKYKLDKNTILLNSQQPQAFCFGFLNPKIYLSTGILNTLKENEIKAIWLHEDFHRSHLHTLKRLFHNIATLFAPMFPLIKELVETQSIQDEIMADREALRYLGRNYLLSSLRKMIVAVDDTTSINYFASYNTLLQRIEVIYEKKIKKTNYIKSSLLSLMSFVILITISTSLVNAKTMQTATCSNEICANLCKNSSLKVPYFKNVSLPISILYSPRG